MAESKENIISKSECHECVHRDVCKFIDDFKDTQLKIKELLRKQSQTDDISFLSEKLECSKYLKEPTQIIKTRGGTGITQI